MTSLFDSTVYAARQFVEWAEIDLEYLLKDLATNGQGPAKLEVHYRPDVASRHWWILRWRGQDGELHSESAQTLHLCLWRAAIREKHIRERIEKQSQKEQEEL